MEYMSQILTGEKKKKKTLNKLLMRGRITNFNNPMDTFNFIPS